MELADAQFQQLAKAYRQSPGLLPTKIKTELLKLNNIKQILARDTLNQLFYKHAGAIGTAIAINLPDVATAHCKDLITLITLNIQKVKLVQYLRIIESFESPTEPCSRPYVSNVPKLQG
jgi:hypothetical protein